MASFIKLALLDVGELTKAVDSWYELQADTDAEEEDAEAAAAEGESKAAAEEAEVAEAEIDEILACYTSNDLWFGI